MFCITREDRRSCDTKIFYYTCKILFIKFYWKALWLNYFMRHYKDIANLLLWVLWECLIMSINYDSTTPCWKLWCPNSWNQLCRKLWYLSPCRKPISSLNSFLRYCKEIVNLLFLELLECLSIPIKNHSLNL